jgi:hypothetical protein
MEPFDYYTWDVVRARKVNEPPRYLFLFTTAADAWILLHPNRPDINELQNGILGLRTTENPQTAGPCVFILDSECLLDLGFTLYPFDDGATPRSAIWRVIDADKKTEFIGDPLHPHVIYNSRRGLRNIPFSCVSVVGIYMQDSKMTKKNVREVTKAALVHGFEVQDFKWQDWWTYRGPIRRTERA